MYRREHFTNISTDVLRTFVTIVEKGSYTKAAEHLGLTQPGISAQVKRLQIYMGGAVFDRTSMGTVLSEKGRLLLPLARLMLETNDNILCLGGVARDPGLIRLGITDLYAAAVMKSPAFDNSEQLHFHCDHLDEIARGLTDGYFDIGCLFDPPAGIGNPIAEWDEGLVWVRARDFVLSPGIAIPLIGWLGSPTDQIGIEALQASGRPYRLVYVSSDHASRLCAVKKGLGVMVLPLRAVDPSICIAVEYYLPPLPALRAGVFVRKSFDVRRARGILNALKELRTFVPGGDLIAEQPTAARLLKTEHQHFLEAD